MSETFPRIYSTTFQSHYNWMNVVVMPWGQTDKQDFLYTVEELKTFYERSEGIKNLANISKKSLEINIKYLYT